VRWTSFPSEPWHTFYSPGRPPADSIAELQEKLRSRYQQWIEYPRCHDGAVDSLVNLVTTSASSQASDRCTVEDFLAGLDLIEEELTSPDEEEKANPLDANKGDRLAGGFLVEKRLGHHVLLGPIVNSVVLDTSIKTVVPGYVDQIACEYSALSNKTCPWSVIAGGPILGQTPSTRTRF
jgi:hypothetical protein